MNQQGSIAPLDLRVARSTRYPWAVVGMLWLICFFNYADRQAISGVFPLLKEEFKFSDTELGLIGTAFMYVYALTAPLAGEVADRFPRKTIILAGLYVWSVITGFTSFCTKVWQFVLVRGAEGLGETFYFPASMSLISDYHTKATRSRALSLHQTSVYVGTVGGGALAGWMGQHYGWRTPFFFLAGLGIVLGLILAAFIREPARNEAERRAAPTAHVKEQEPLAWMHFLREFRATPSAVCLITVFFGANMVAGVVLVWMPYYVRNDFNQSVALAAFLGTFFIHMASMFGSPLGGFLADRWRSRHAGGRILVQALGMFLGAPFIFLCGSTRDLTMLIIVMTLFGLFKGIYDSNVWASLFDVIAPSRRSTGVGWMNFIGWMGAGLGSLVVGVASDHQIPIRTSIASMGLVYLLGSALLLAAGWWWAPGDVRRSAVEPAIQPDPIMPHVQAGSVEPPSASQYPSNNE